MRRALAWLGAGVLALALLIVATAPQLVGADLGALTGMLLVILLAGIPGVGIMVVAAVRRWGRTTDEHAAAVDRGPR